MPNILDPVFYDIEASGLEGFPIEAGWACLTSNGLIRSKAWLIYPPPEWDLDNDWDSEAEALHGVTLARLLSKGMPVVEVARQLNGDLANRELFADSPFDPAWLDQIFEAAGMAPSFEVRHHLADRLILDQAANRGITQDAFQALQQQAARLAPRTHRAEADARHLAMLWKMVRS